MLLKHKAKGRGYRTRVQPSDGRRKSFPIRQHRCSTSHGVVGSGCLKTACHGKIGRPLFVSPSHLRALVKRVTGRSLRQHLRAGRVELARQLLHESPENVAAISQRVGCHSIPHFCTVFKRETGMTPSQFSRSLGRPEF